MFVTVTAPPTLVLFLQNISRNILKTAKWLPSWRVWPEYAQWLPQGSPRTQHSGRDQVVKRRKYLWASLQFAAGDVTLCKWVSNFATLLVLTTFSSKSRSIVWWRSNHCDLVTMKWGLPEVTSCPPLIGWSLKLVPLIGWKLSKVPFDVADNTRFHEPKTMNLWQATR